MKIIRKTFFTSKSKSWTTPQMYYSWSWPAACWRFGFGDSFGFGNL